MTVPSPRLGLALPSQTDRFSTQDIRNNWEKLDAAPGTHICTSTTRPTTWGSAQAGRRIIETNTGLEWVWTGTTWARITAGQSILKRADGTPAIAERTTTFSTSSETFVRVITLTNVVVPAGNRPLMLVANFEQADNNQGGFVCAIFRSSVNNSGPQMSKWLIGNYGGKTGGGNSLVTFERGGLPPSTYDFSFQIRSIDNVGGSSQVFATTTQPIQLVVCEL